MLILILKTVRRVWLLFHVRRQPAIFVSEREKSFHTNQTRSLETLGRDWVF